MKIIIMYIYKKKEIWNSTWTMAYLFNRGRYENHVYASTAYVRGAQCRIYEHSTEISERSDGFWTAKEGSFRRLGIRHLGCFRTFAQNVGRANQYVDAMRAYQADYYRPYPAEYHPAIFDRIRHGEDSGTEGWF